MNLSFNMRTNTSEEPKNGVLIGTGTVNGYRSGIEVANKKNASEANIFITERDIEIIKFILEMKFATVKDIHLRIFKVNQLGNESITLRAAYKRLYLLEKNLFLKTTRNFLINQKIFLATSKAYYLLLTKPTDVLIAHPSKNLDHRTFDHDHKLIELRSILEKTTDIAIWKSDRYIRSKPEFTDLNKLNIIPDAIIVNSSGQKIALELELTLKSKNRYKTKIRNTVQYIRSNNINKCFEKVVYACSKNSILETLKKETALYKNYFELNMLEQYFLKDKVI